MSARTVRLAKEARLLLWPWCLVTAAGLLSFRPSLLRPYTWSRAHPEQPIIAVGVSIGIPLLAALVLGYEFQYRTFSLLLSQAVDRRELWRDKLTIMLAAVLPPALIYAASARANGMTMDSGLEVWVLSAAWVLVMTAAAFVWTLRARSTLGGLALNGGVHYPFFAGWAYLAYRLRLAGHDSFAFVGISAVALFAYAAAMFWLGRRSFLRYQDVGGVAGGDVLAGASPLVPDFVADSVRPRRQGAVLNLLRLELYLLRPVWAFTLLSMLLWTALLLFGVVPPRGSHPGRHTTDYLIGVAMILSWLIAILAGMVSLGEEKTLGTHAWHRTLPMSSRQQWLVKFLVAVTAGGIGGGLVPVLVLMAGGWLSGSAFLYADPDLALRAPLVLALFTVMAFWCACVMHGTVRAILLFFPACILINLAVISGTWTAEKLAAASSPIFDRWFLGVDPFKLPMPDLWLDWTLVPFSLAILAALAAFHSYRIFRAQGEDNKLWLLRCLLPAAVTIFIFAFLAADFVRFEIRVQRQRMLVLQETHAAIQKLAPAAASLDAAPPLHLTAADLAQASPLSQSTRLWLEGSSITVTRQHVLYLPHVLTFGVPPTAQRGSSYVAVVQRSNRVPCTLSFQTTGSGYGLLGSTCE